MVENNTDAVKNGEVEKTDGAICFRSPEEKNALRRALSGYLFTLTEAEVDGQASELELANLIILRAAYQAATVDLNLSETHQPIDMLQYGIIESISLEILNKLAANGTQGTDNRIQKKAKYFLEKKKSQQLSTNI